MITETQLAPHNILALDVATVTGWAMTIHGSVKHGTLDLPTDDYGHMASVWARWLTDKLFAMDAVVIERPVMSVASDSLYRCNGLVFVAHQMAWAQDKRRLEVTSTEWRKFIFGTGRMKTSLAKQRALGWARENGYDPDTADAAEALCILEWAINRGGLTKREAA